MGKIIVFSNQKGGVGKTTTCVNMAAYIARRGYKALVVDFDPQGNATTALGIDKKGITLSSYNLLIDEIFDTKEVILETPVKDLKIIPSNISLAGAEVELAELPKREFKLKQALSKIVDDFDFILIDCPPSLGLLTINALTACDGVLIPIQSEFFALEGLAQLINTIKIVKKKLNPNIDIDGVIITMYDARSLTAKQISNQILQFFGKKIFSIAIPRNVRLSEAPSYGVPIVLHDKSCAGARAYEFVTDEFLKKQKER